jgi:hypothetical protein
MNPTLLADRLAQLRKSNAAANPSPLSEHRVPHNLSTFLILYNKSSRECNLSYMEGAKLLNGYLTSGFLFPLDIQEEVYPRILDTTYKLPALLSSYELGQLVTILAPNAPTYGEVYAKYKRAIVITTLALMAEGKI